MKKAHLVAISAGVIAASCASAPSAPPPCSAPAAQSAAVDPLHTIFGEIGIGQPLRMPECSKLRVGLSEQYIAYSERTCYQRTVDIPACSAITDGYAGVEFPIGTLPVWAYGSRVIVRIVGGTVQGVRISTRGVGSQARALQELTQKYGAPSVSGTEVVQNRMGAQYESINASWTVSDLSVVFLGTTGRLDGGQVNIATPAGQAAFDADHAKLLGGQKPL